MYKTRWQARGLAFMLRHIAEDPRLRAEKRLRQRAGRGIDRSAELFIGCEFGDEREDLVGVGGHGGTNVNERHGALCSVPRPDSSVSKR